MGGQYEEKKNKGQREMESPPAVKTRKERRENQRAEKPEYNGVGYPSVPSESCRFAEKWHDDHIEIWQGAEKRTPCRAPPAKLFTESELADDGPEGGLRDGVHIIGNVAGCDYWARKRRTQRARLCNSVSIPSTNRYGAVAGSGTLIDGVLPSQ